MRLARARAPDALGRFTCLTARGGSQVRAAGLSTRAAPAASVAWVDPSPDPMAGDIEDPDATLARRTLWVTTAGFGDVHARAAGRPEDPLLLCVRHARVHFPYGPPFDICKPVCVT